MILRYSDVPTLVSLDYLRGIDRDPPGTWLAQKKCDGVRRMAYHTPQGWVYIAKNRSDSKPIQPALKEAFESLPWSVGVGVDMEMTGPRHAGGKHQLWIFDILAVPNHGQSMWVGDMPFDARATLLKLNAWFDPPLINYVETVPNPGLVDFYAEQLTDPLSEGLVVRRANSKLIGSTKGCAVNPHWFKVKHREAVKELP